MAQSVETLARRADLIVRGCAERSVCRTTSDGKQIYTVTTVRVARALKGSAGALVEVHTPGGVVGEEGRSKKKIVLERIEADRKSYSFDACGRSHGYV